MIPKTAAQPDWRATWSTSVDYSTMVMGYALKYLPDNFYPTYNSAIIEEATSKSQSELQLNDSFKRPLIKKFRMTNIIR